MYLFVLSARGGEGDITMQIGQWNLSQGELSSPIECFIPQTA